MKCFFVVLPVIVGLLVPAAQAQPAATSERSPPTAPLETVIVTGRVIAPVPQRVVEKLVATRIAPMRLVGKVARWANPICPQVIGLNPAGSAALVQRIRDVATTVGAPVNTNMSCSPNATIIFTATPQALLNDIEAHHPLLLGDHDSTLQAKEMATVSHPIQAWYATATEAKSGYYGPGRNSNGEILSNVSEENATGGAQLDNSENSPGNYPVSGFTLDNGLSSIFANVLIVADRNKMIGGYSFGAISDYIAMLALSQNKTFDTCDELPSIVNLMSPKCDAQWKATTLTAADIAYLHALYRMQPAGSFNSQKGDIVQGMEDYLNGQ